MSMVNASKIYRVVDYFHASERLTVIADCIKFGKAKDARSDWLGRVRKLLLEKGGHGRVMRSIAAIKRKTQNQIGKASRFRQSRWLPEQPETLHEIFRNETAELSHR